MRNLTNKKTTKKRKQKKQCRDRIRLKETNEREYYTAKSSLHCHCAASSVHAWEVLALLGINPRNKESFNFCLVLPYSSLSTAMRDLIEVPLC